MKYMKYMIDGYCSIFGSSGHHSGFRQSVSDDFLIVDDDIAFVMREMLFATFFRSIRTSQYDAVVRKLNHSTERRKK